MKVLAIAALSARHALHARGEALARVAFFGVVVLVFSRLWAVMGPAAGALGFDAAMFVWYIAITECVALGTPHLYLAIEEDVRKGDVAYLIARPVSYFATRLAEGAGDACVRALFLAAAALPIAWLSAGSVPDPRGLALAVPLVLLAVFVMVVFQALVGLTAFWLQEATPVFWIWQKLLFVLGGLMIPLEIYPEWLQAVAAWTPCEPLLHGCGAMAFGFDPVGAAMTAGRLLAWGALGLGLAALLYRRGLRVLDVNGG